MRVDIKPERKLNSTSSEMDLGVRVTLHLTGRSKEDKQKMMEAWEKLERDDSVHELIKLIGEYADTPPGHDK